MDGQFTDWLPDSFYRSPFWRVLRASYLLETGLPADATIDDDWVAVAKDLLAAIERHDLSTVPEAVRAAYEVWAADQMPRWLVEAQLLTPRTLDEIATECALAEPVVHAYAELFFDVRSRLQARDWVMSLAVRSHPMNDFAGPQPAGLWKFFAFTGGELVLDVVVAVTLNRPLPEWLRSQFTTNPRVEEQRLRLKVKLAIAALTAKGVYELGTVVEMAEQLRDLDKVAGVPVNEAESLTPLVREFFTMLSRPQPAGQEAGVRTPAQDTITVREPDPTHTTGNQDRRRS